MSDLVNFLTSKRYVGVRLRSIRKHCRLGRATELVIILSTGVSIVLGGTSVQAQQAWQDGNADDTWNTTSANWDAGVIFTEGNDAVFGGTGETVTIDEPGGIEVDDVTFDVDGYSIIGNDLEVTGTISVTNAADSATIEANISSDVVIGGDGTVALAGDTTGDLTTAGGADIDGDITGNLISSGTTTLAGDVSGTVAQSAGSVTVDGASTLTGAVTI
ncbi:MAG: polymer-forming cytoskeletal protein, partial [Pseudoprimorskyibacter sp.]|nr:polymer-forming cytoskeletal protein [Pseudoprimorskyibacter sp.]